MTKPASPTWPLVFLALASVVFWWPCLIGGRVPVAAVYQQQMPPFGAPATPPPRAWDALLWDSMAQFYPWRVLLQRGLRSGELPLWNPHQYCGYPFVGNGQSAIFYPPNWLLLWVDAKYFLGLSLALHWFLAGALAFFLARTLGLRPAAATLAGLLYQSSGFMITWAELPTIVNTMAWLPGAWLGVELLFRASAPPLLQGEGAGGEAPRRAGSSPHAGLLLLSASLGLCLLAGHLQFAAYIWLTTASYALARALYRWFTRRPAPVFGLVLSAALGLGLGLPQVLPSLELARYSPRGATEVSAEGWQFQQQRALQPVELLTFIWPEALGDPVTGTYPGISYTEHCAYAGVLALLLALLGVALRRDRWSAFYGVGALAALSIAMAGPLAWLLYYGLPMLGLTGGFARILGVYTLLLAVLAGRGLDALLALLSRRGPTAPARRSKKSPPPGPSGASERELGGEGIRLAIPALALLLVCFELFPWGWRFLPLAKQAEVYPDTALTRLLQEKGKDPDYRVLTITPRENWTIDRLPTALLPPNAATVYGWYSPDGYDSLSLASYRTWAEQAEGAGVSPLANGNMMLLNNPQSRLLDEAAVRWLVRSTPLSVPDLRLVGRTDGAYAYEVRSRSLVSHSYISAGPLPAPVQARTLNTLTTDRVGPEGTDVATAFYPAWRAYADARLVEITAPRGALSWVPRLDRPAELWLAFYPASVVVGLFLGLLSLAVLAGTLAASFVGRSRP